MSASTRPLLVATDGGRSAGHAMHFAAGLAERTGAAVEVVAVMESLAAGPVDLPHREELEKAYARGVAERVTAQLNEELGDVSWPTHLRVGRPAAVIAEVARERDASFILLAMDGERSECHPTGTELIQLCDRPILHVKGPELPKTAVVGIDFRESSLEAAHAAAGLVGPEGTVHLVHVQPRLDFPAAMVWDWSECYGTEVADGFRRLREALAATGFGRVEEHVGDGDPATELIRYARAVDADLLAIGGDGYLFRGRILMGRVAQQLVREATVTVLTTPASPAWAPQPAAAGPTNEAARAS